MSDLGPCCGCGCTGEGVVRNIMMLDQEGPEGFNGWACFVCDLPARGAIAVLCDACLRKPPIHCCGGTYPKDGIRVALADFPKVPFEHDMSKHQADEW